MTPERASHPSRPPPRTAIATRLCVARTRGAMVVPTACACRSGPTRRPCRTTKVNYGGSTAVAWNHLIHAIYLVRLLCTYQYLVWHVGPPAQEAIQAINSSSTLLFEHVHIYIYIYVCKVYLGKRCLASCQYAARTSGSASNNVRHRYVSIRIYHHGKQFVFVAILDAYTRYPVKMQSSSYTAVCVFFN